MRQSDFIELLGEMMNLPDTLTPESRLRGTAEFDSLAVMSILTLIYSNFQTMLKAVKIAECRTVADLLELIGKDKFAQE